MVEKFRLNESAKDRLERHRPHLPCCTAMPPLAAGLQVVEKQPVLKIVQGK